LRRTLVLKNSYELLVAGYKRSTTSS